MNPTLGESCVFFNNLIVNNGSPVITGKCEFNGRSVLVWFLSSNPYILHGPQRSSHGGSVHSDPIYCHIQKFFSRKDFEKRFTLWNWVFLFNSEIYVYNGASGRSTTIFFRRNNGILEHSTTENSCKYSWLGSFDSVGKFPFLSKMYSVTSVVPGYCMRCDVMSSSGSYQIWPWNLESVSLQCCELLLFLAAWVNPK